ncbi:hypothetical protein [Paenibacillus graminis]|uniref:hypothetical protein n=1 Tax=Paenibacillus graminis TaxID=189425 RepID=UPI002DBD0920|nr:hypothetical protein [Paenibacillus graminis]MEC0168153.1 hypothetical protein [Paenibacillus graminis]
MKKLFASLVSVVMMLSFSSVGFASEAPTSLSADTKSEIKLHLTKDLGVSEIIANSLIEKIESGELPDSDNPEKAGTGVTSTSTESDKTVARTVFPDGSVIISTVDTTNATVEVVEPKENNIEPGGMTTMGSPTGGWTESGSGYKKFYNTTVYEESTLVQARFQADYVLVNGSYDYISRVSDGFAKGIGGYCTGQNLFIIGTGYQTYDSPARATLAFTYVGINGTWSTDFKLQLYVMNDSATSQLDTF